LEQRVQTADRLRQRLEQAIRGRLRERRLALQHVRVALWGAAPNRRLRERRLQLAALAQRLRALGRSLVTRRRQRLAPLAGRLDALSPLAVLERGYAIVSREHDGQVVRSPDDVTAGELVAVRLARGRVRAEVLAAEPGQPADPPVRGGSALTP
jgi:exodeoxyribonuclease VII large subunit